MATTAAAKPHTKRRRFVLYAGIAAAILAANWVIDRLSRAPDLKFKTVVLTEFPGSQTSPALSPDGRMVAFAWMGEKRDDRYHMFVKSVDGGQPLALTQGAGNEYSPAWSPDGTQLAFARAGERLEYFVVPAVGGAERKVADFNAAGLDPDPAPLVSWSRDGRALLASGKSEAGPWRIFRISLDTREKQAVTMPAPDITGDLTPVPSPDGRSFAFVRRDQEGRGDIYTAPLEPGSQARQITFDRRSIRGLDWTPDGRKIIFSADRLDGAQQLWRIPAGGGSASQVVKTLENGQYPSLWRIELPDAAGKTREPGPLISSPKREFGSQYSPDAKRIAFISDRSGDNQIWVCDSNGDDAVQLTSYKGAELNRLRWSPDGRQIMYELNGRGIEGVFTISATGGSPKRVNFQDGAKSASWSADGKHIYYRWRRSIWKMPAEGGEAVQVTRTADAWDMAVSPDGKYVFFANHRGLWRVPANASIGKPGDDEPEVPTSRGPEEKRIELGAFRFGRPGSWVVTRKGIYTLEREPGSRGMALQFFDFASEQSRTVTTIDQVWLGWPPTFTVSQDGRFALYSHVDVSSGHLSMYENFR